MRPRINKIQKRQLGRLTARTYDIPAPVGGLNTRDSLSVMPPTDAIQLINLIPQQNGVISRHGYEPASDDYTGNVETLIPYIQGTDQYFIAGADGELWTDDGTTATSIGSGFGSDIWDGVKLGINMVLVNGADAPRNWNGSALTTPSFSGDLATYGTSNIDGIHKHKNRVYMWDTGYPNFFYGDTNSVSGSFAEFPLSSVSDTSGNIIEVKTISQDSGNGPDDYLAFFLHTGEVIIYQGSDPSDATNWSLVGKYKAPPLIGKRCATEFAGDILMLTKQDVVKLSNVIRYTNEEGGFNVQPSKLSGAIANNYNTYSSNFGFSIMGYSKAGWIIINIPYAAGSEYSQYVINTTTGAACQFTGWNAITFGVLGDNLYFGADQLYKANSGFDDNGSDINLLAQQAFSNFMSGNKKKVSNARLYIASDGELSIALAMGFDFSFPNPQGVQSSTTVGAEWDVASWDTADWASTQARLINFVTGGIGVHVGLQISLQIQGQIINWFATTYNYDMAEAY